MARAGGKGEKLSLSLNPLQGRIRTTVGEGLVDCKRESPSLTTIVTNSSDEYIKKLRKEIV